MMWKFKVKVYALFFIGECERSMFLFNENLIEEEIASKKPTGVVVRFDAPATSREIV